MIDLRSHWLPIAVYASLLATPALAQTPPAEPAAESVEPELPGREKSPQAPAVVEVQPVAGDEQIVARLEKILQATGWFESPQVSVDEGVVFLRGQTDLEQYKKWAGDLASKTRDVVAVVNQIDVTRPSPWNFQPALAGIRELVRSAIVWIPYAVLALLIILVTFLLAALVTRGLHSFLASRVRVSLLRTVIARAAGLLVFLVGLYIVLKVCGLTRLALTVIGGTGLFGLVIGIAFRDIAENFLASILLSLQAPFRAGDLIELAGVSGIVQQLNVRTTVLMSPMGHHIQLPNALVYKSTIQNYTSNPNRRVDFAVGIGYDVPIARAQEVAQSVLDSHPAVLKNPEPWVLVDGLGSATVNLRVYFWVDGSQFSWLKVKSSVIRLVKLAYQENNISMPDEVREVIFPQGVPVRGIAGTQTATADEDQPPAPTPPQLPAEEVATPAEAGLGSDAPQIEEQAHQSRTPDEGENLLDSSK
jgi:small conductance mechanosensitive channel